ncbi:hypothetical protein [Limnoglobus roseus]|uniref:Uncharacterized protein n=1 Tax=Limnoglobus roseus TaxID=2598579 RepID=A0A5C1AJB7_9BACT|nr:hypothetical protein [Limnoglobus roseus]QEL16998.1 hypothetical protein PX52LOC_03974 [Limnoglobus roseus]
MVAVMLGVMLAHATTVSGDATVRGKAGPSDIVVTTTTRLAGAIHSVTWNGKEFIDSTDHGRQLQSACAFDCGRPNFWAEAYNPTEAGSRRDGAGPRSTSQLLRLRAAGNVLETKSRTAFWLNPGEKSEKYPALNAKPLSDHLLSKTVTVGHQGLAHAIEYAVTFSVPPTERHTFAQFEALTGYMPAEFRVFETFDPQTKQLADITDGPGEQKRPLVFSTPTGSHAMGVISFDLPKGLSGPSYGRWRFQAEKVVKWNAVYRLRDPDGVPPGEYRFQLFVAVGSRENVRATLEQLIALQK